SAARGAVTARVNSAVEAIQSLRDGDGGEPFADAGWAGKEEAWRKGAAADRSLQQVDEPVMADHFAERHRTGMLSRATRRPSFSVAAVRRAWSGPLTRCPAQFRRRATRSRVSSAPAEVAAAARRVPARRSSPRARALARRRDRPRAAAPGDRSHRR